MKKTPKKESELQKDVELFFREQHQLLKRLGLGMRMIIAFDHLKHPPFLSRIAIVILRRQGGKLDTEFKKKEWQ